MTTLGTHPFIPGASKLGSPIPCQKCPNDAAHAVHDWLSFSPITPEEMVQLPNLLTADGPINAPIHHVFCTCPLCVEWVAKQRTRIGNTPDVGTDDDDFTDDEHIENMRELGIGVSRGGR